MNDKQIENAKEFEKVKSSLVKIMNLKRIELVLDHEVMQEAGLAGEVVSRDILNFDMFAKHYFGLHYGVDVSSYI